MNIHEEMREYRKTSKISQQKLAELLGVTQAMIYLVEKGERGLGKEPSYRLHKLSPKTFPIKSLFCPECRD